MFVCAFDTFSENANNAKAPARSSFVVVVWPGTSMGVSCPSQRGSDTTHEPALPLRELRPLELALLIYLTPIVQCKSRQVHAYSSCLFVVFTWTHPAGWLPTARATVVASSSTPLKALVMVNGTPHSTWPGLFHLFPMGLPHQRRGNVAEGVDNNVGRFHQKCQNFRHHVRNFLWPNLRLVLERNFCFRKKMILPEMFFLLFLLNINVAVRPFIGPPLALYLPCSITGACLPPSCHLTFVFWANYGFTRPNTAVTRLNSWSWVLTILDHSFLIHSTLFYSLHVHYSVNHLSFIGLTDRDRGTTWSQQPNRRRRHVSFLRRKLSYNMKQQSTIQMS